MPESIVTVTLPEMGESVAEGSITAWRKQPGDFVSAGDAIVDVTTDKVDVEVPAPASGKLVKILAAEGTTIGVGAPLAEIDTSFEGPAHGGPTTSRADTGSTSAPTTTPGAGSARPAVIQPEPHVVGPASAGPAPDASPLAKRKAIIEGIALQRVTGSGPGGVIRKDDVIKGTSFAGPHADGKVSPLKGAAATLAAYMEQSLEIPTATSFRTIAVDTLDARRRELNNALRAAGRPEKVSYTHLVAFALVRATRDVPNMTAFFQRGSAGPQRVQRGAQLGLAVDVQRKDGSHFLLVPVIARADALDFTAFHSAYEDLIRKARTNALSPAEMSGATITLTNPGGLGTVASVPRLMPGQGTIVAAGAIGYPSGLANVPESTLRSLGVSKVMTLTSTYDHRVIQGAESGEFLRRIEQLLSGADSFYEDVFAGMGLPRPTWEVARTADAGTPAAGGTLSESDILRAAAAAAALIMRYRAHGHTAAMLDPLGARVDPDPALDPSSLGLTPEMAAAVPASVLRTHVPGKNLADVIAGLRHTYCSTIAYQVEHISNHEQRAWLREQIESGAHRAPPSRDERIRLLERLSEVESFERYLRKTFLGQKTFSIEGLDVMVPMIDLGISLTQDDGAQEIDIGMAHRGRLAVITHIVSRSFDDALLEFERAELRGVTDAVGDATGDVKYHQGAVGEFTGTAGKRTRVLLSNNPSHLEAVNSVVEGETRAAQTDRTTNVAQVDHRRAVALLIHGDAAFVGQGSVAEVLNMQGLEGYSTGGTLHIIANNQIGFTTEPFEARSTRYASDLAKGFDVPIIHVNADDVEACLSAIRLAVGFRKRFQRDTLIDLVGYRRFGHNETDEPAYTQPEMYDKIKAHPTARELYARRLVQEGLTTEEEAKRLADAAYKRVADAHASIKKQAASGKLSESKSASRNGAEAQPPVTAVPLETLVDYDKQLLTVPDGFTVHPKLVRQLERRRGSLASPSGEIEWGHAEALAFASLVSDGVPVRLTGQDTQRGTFSQRHSVLHDPQTGQRHVPLQHIRQARASFEVYNSPLSEFACLGFEYGYSAAVEEALVLWEAQYGDFNNGAQVIIDQFIAAGMAKWGVTSRLTLLLPHGYEGAGPEHSSARLERFLQLAADGNIRIANCSTPAQYFHLLRDQGLNRRPRPLVIMTPKSLLRLKAAASAPAEFASGGFAPVLDDPSVTDRASVQRLILCSGKIYYDLSGDKRRANQADLAIVRVELLEPFPLEDVLRIVASYPNVRAVAWVQEEPKNQGARAFISRRIRERLMPQGIAYGYIGRADRASPSEGYPGAHAVEQERIVGAALQMQAAELAR